MYLAALSSVYSAVVSGQLDVASCIIVFDEVMAQATFVPYRSTTAVHPGRFRQYVFDCAGPEGGVFSH
jgi:hypothetical protein